MRRAHLVEGEPVGGHDVVARDPRRGATDAKLVRVAARIRTALTIVILVMANAGCGDAQGTSSAPSTTIAPVWKVSAPMVEVGPPDPMLLPSPTPGVTITGVDLPADDVLAPDMGPDRSAQTLWADPTVADPLQGRVLVVGRTELSDTEGGFDLKGRPVDIGGSEATIGRRGPLVIVSWPLPVTECACDQAVVVAGRNLSEDQVLLAARGTRPRRSAVHRPERPSGRFAIAGHIVGFRARRSLVHDSEETLDPPQVKCGGTPHRGRRRASPHPSQVLDRRPDHA